jgi:hypothetical protein
MPSFSSILVPLRRPLTAPLDRLCRTLDSLSREVRDAIARAIGQAVSEAVREAVHAVLEEPPLQPEKPGCPHDLSVRPPPAWEEPDEAYWAGDPDALEEPDDFLYPDAAGEERFARQTPESFRPPPGQRPAMPRDSRWSQAVTAGLLAAAWWLRRSPGRCSLLSALGVSLIAGLAALVGGPLAAAVAGAAGSALMLLGLADAVRYGCPPETNSRSH